jgi:hypothetical protein
MSVTAIFVIYKSCHDCGPFDVELVSRYERPEGRLVNPYGRS